MHCAPLVICFPIRHAYTTLRMDAHRVNVAAQHHGHGKLVAALNHLGQLRHAPVHAWICPEHSFGSGCNISIEFVLCRTMEQDLYSCCNACA